MSVSGRRVTVGTDAVRLDPDDRQFWAAVITNRGTAVVDLDDTGVAAGTGYELRPGDSVPVQLGPRDKGLSAVAGSAGHILHILETIN